MVVMYNIAGRQIGSHWLAMTTLATVFGATAFSMSGGAAKKAQGPPINAQSPDEEKFIQDFLKQAEGGDASHGNNVDMTKKDAGR